MKFIPELAGMLSLGMVSVSGFGAELQPSGPHQGAAIQNKTIIDVAPLKNPTLPGYGYTETLHPEADLGDIKSGYTQEKWRESLLEVLKRRYPSGYQLMEQMKNNKYLEQFAKQSTFVKLVSNFYVSVHEMTHMWDLNYLAGGTDLSPSELFQQWGQDNCFFSANQKHWIRVDWKPSVDASGGFPRSEIKSMVEGNISSSMDNSYLAGDQGKYLYWAILAELNGYITGLAATGMAGEHATDFVAKFSKDNAITSMYWTQLYLRRARTAHKDFYDKLKSDQVMKDLILIQWLRLHYFLRLTEKFPHLGNNVKAHLDRLHKSDNVAEIELFTGHKLDKQQFDHVAPDDDYKPPFPVTQPE